jgi:hypothetical protein
MIRASACLLRTLFITWARRRRFTHLHAPSYSLMPLLHAHLATRRMNAPAQNISNIPSARRARRKGARTRRPPPLVAAAAAAAAHVSALLLLFALATLALYTACTGAIATTRAVRTLPQQAPHLARTNGGAYGDTLRQLMTNDGYLDCALTPCTATPLGLAQWQMNYRSDNSMTGTIPPQIGLFPSLQQLRLNDNSNISGTLPSQLGLLASMNTL